MDTQSVLAKQEAVQGTIVAGIAVKLVQKHMECIMWRQGQSDIHCIGICKIRQHTQIRKRYMAH
jgi:hypothetical protein